MTEEDCFDWHVFFWKLLTEKWLKFEEEVSMKNYTKTRKKEKKGNDSQFQTKVRKG